MKENGKLFVTFCKIGAFTFGGGYAMIPLIKAEVVHKEGWLKEKELVDMLAVSESTPGSLAVNMATFVGYRVSGVFGAALATLGVVLPSFIIIAVLSFLIEMVKDNDLVRYAFWGIRIGVLSLILAAFVTVFKNCKKNIFSMLLILAAFALVAFGGINSMFVLAGCALAGIVYGAICDRRKKYREGRDGQ